MGIIDINKELEDFESDLNSSKNKLKLIIDEVDHKDYDYEGGLKLSDITPIYSKRSVHIVDIRKKSTSGNNLF